MFKRGVSAIGFSPSGKFLTVCTLDEDHTVFLFDLKSDALIYSLKSGAQTIVSLTFRSEEEFVVVGPKLYQIWKVNLGAKMENGNFG